MQIKDRLTQMTDRQLIEAYAGTHDCVAFGTFVDRHQGPLLAFAAAFLRDDSLAQDIVQEAFLRAARNPQRLLRSDGGGERNWLLKVVRDLSIDSIRRRASERRMVSTLTTVRSNTAPAADAQLERNEDVARLGVAIDRLKPRYRELLLLKVREKKSYKEIAAITGLSVTNVGFLLHQAMTALSGELKEEGTRTE
jgi:RNA polymerase sigma factor (sigma-70 family)